MKQIILIPLILTMLANAPFAQQYRVRTFEIKERKNLSYGGHNVGKLYLEIDGKKRKIADEAAYAWIINGGKQVVFSGADGAGGFENVGQSLRIYEVRTGKIRKIFSEYFSVEGITEVKLSNGARLLLVRSGYDESDELSFAVIDPKRGEIFMKAPAELIAVKGDFITLGRDAPSKYEPDENNHTAFALPRTVKPEKISKYDLKKILKNKVIFNRRTE